MKHIQEPYIFVSGKSLLKFPQARLHNVVGDFAHIVHKEVAVEGLKERHDCALVGPHLGLGLGRNVRALVGYKQELDLNKTGKRESARIQTRL
jgi:hypothetical protein